MGHHNHSPEHSHNVAKTHLNTILILTTVFMVVELVGGWWTGSLALLSDAGHMFSDMASLWIARIAVIIVEKPANRLKTYGYHRAEVLAAFFNAIILMALSIFIVFEAVKRVQVPREILPLPMLGIAVGGLIVNIIGVKLLHKSKDENLNIRGAYLHIMGDLLGSLAAIVAGTLIVTKGWFKADTVVSFIIAALIIISAFKLFWDTLHILMQGSPLGLDQEKLKKDLHAIPGVRSVDHLHVWSLGSQFIVASVHLKIEDPKNFQKVQQEARDYLMLRCNIDHPTIQIDL